MGNVKWLTGFTIICCSLTVHAQAQRQAPQQKTNSAQQSNLQGNINVTQQNTGDTRGAANAPNASQNQESKGGANTSARPADTLAVPTTSASGSPAVLSGKDGSQRDGTNNVQRASMNMAGSPANNLRLSEKRSVNSDSEIRGRQRNSRDKQISAER